MAGMISGSVMREEHRRRPRAQIHRRLFQRLVEARQPRLHDHGHVGHAEGDVRDRDRVAPRPRGQPISCSSATNSSSSDRPVITSGMHQRRGGHAGEQRCGRGSGRTAPAPRRPACPESRRRWRSSARSGSTATRRPGSASLCNSSPYHLSVGECAASHTVTRRELLNENTIIDRIGTYRNAKPNASAVRRSSARAAHRVRLQLARAGSAGTS